MKKNPYQLTVPDEWNLMITRAALATTEKAPTVLSVKSDDEAYVLGTFRWEGVEQFTLDILIVGGSELEFIVKGKGEIHLSGYVNMRCEVDSDDMDSDSDDSDGFDIEGPMDSESDSFDGMAIEDVTEQEEAKTKVTTNAKSGTRLGSPKLPVSPKDVAKIEEKKPEPAKTEAPNPPGGKKKRKRNKGGQQTPNKTPPETPETKSPATTPSGARTPQAAAQTPEAKPAAKGQTPPAAKGQNPTAKGQSPPAAKGQTPPAAKGQTPPAAKGQTPPAAKGQTPPAAKGQKRTADSPNADTPRPNKKAKRNKKNNAATNQ